MHQPFIQHIEHRLCLLRGKQVNLVNIRSLSGGCINNGYEFVTDDGSVFIKTNSAYRFPGMFQTEAEGLKLLAQSQSIRIPKVIEAGQFEDNAFLILEFIHNNPKKDDYWLDFGQKLAILHRNTAPFFGLDHDNYIGSLPQINHYNPSWPDFFISSRLQPLVKQAFSQGLADKELVRLFDQLYNRFDSLIPDENPALLHGDLWSGNVITDEHGQVCLIDPAIYYGHREADVAFSTLFGSFPDIFYQAYNENFPLEKNWQHRIDLFNLYPLLVHLLLFGSSYYGQLKCALSKYL
jgi:protein-ribulosamine 3-kinase